MGLDSPLPRMKLMRGLKIMGVDRKILCGQTLNPTACVAHHTFDQFEVHSLGDISIKVRTGRFIAITIASGSGEAALLDMIPGTKCATWRYVKVGGKEIGLEQERPRELARAADRTGVAVLQF